MSRHWRQELSVRKYPPSLELSCGPSDLSRRRSACNVPHVHRPRPISTCSLLCPLGQIDNRPTLDPRTGRTAQEERSIAEVRIDAGAAEERRLIAVSRDLAIEAANHRVRGAGFLNVAIRHLHSLTVNE